MIRDPRALLDIVFRDDWDLGRDRIIGILRVPYALRGDVRALVNLFSDCNLVHPDLRSHTLNDPWAEERARKWAEAEAKYPLQFVYPVETIIPVITANGQIYRRSDGNIPILGHELHYEAKDYKPRGAR